MPNPTWADGTTPALDAANLDYLMYTDGSNATSTPGFPAGTTIGGKAPVLSDGTNSSLTQSNISFDSSEATSQTESTSLLSNLKRLRYAVMTLLGLSSWSSVLSNTKKAILQDGTNAASSITFPGTLATASSLTVSANGASVTGGLTTDTITLTGTDITGPASPPHQPTVTDIGSSTNGVALASWSTNLRGSITVTLKSATFPSINLAFYNNSVASATLLQKVIFSYGWFGQAAPNNAIVQMNGGSGSAGSMGFGISGSGGASQIIANNTLVINYLYIG